MMKSNAHLQIVTGAALAILMLLLPVAALAQEDPGELVGVYRTAPMENEITGETIVREITLFDDTLAESVTEFLEAGSTVYEVGNWYPTPEGTAVVTFVLSMDYRGGRQKAIEPPLEIVFEVVDGSLVAEEYLAYGPGDLVLERTDETPESILDDDGELRAELREGLDEYPDSLYLGSYRSQDFVLEETEAWLSLTLEEEGRARFEYPAGIVSETAVASDAHWQNHGDGTIGIEVLADMDEAGEVIEEYDPPEEFTTLRRLESGGLVSEEFLLPDGSQIIFSRTDGAPVEIDTSAAGVYATIVSDAHETPIGMIINLAPDGTAQFAYVSFDGESAPVSAVGRWEQEAESVTLYFTHEIVRSGSGVRLKEVAVYPAETFTITNGLLTNEDATLYPIPAAGAEERAQIEAEAEAESEATSEEVAAEPGEDATYMVSREELRAGNTVVLSLMGDGSAAMSTQLGADAPTVVELGRWSEEDGQVTVTLERGIDNVEYDEPNVLVFERSDERTLTATEYDAELYGEELILFDTRDY